MNPIQRYNQGFGIFGPLEKCDTGKLAFYADMEAWYLHLQALSESDAARRIDAEAYAERRTRQVLDLTDANERLQARVGDLIAYGDKWFEKADAMVWDLKTADHQNATLKAELDTAKRAKKVWFRVSWLLAGFIIGAAIGKAFF